MLGFVALTLLAGFASASVTLVNMRGWYMNLMAPAFAPRPPLPDAAAALLAILYVAMGVAAWLVWRGRKPVSQQRSALKAWGWQLALGAAWPAMFFGFHALGPALIIAAALLSCTVLTVRRFAGLDAAGSILLVPYLASAGFACYLNAGFWWLNH